MGGVRLPIYQVDAFTDRRFHGNPAAVVPLDEWLPNDVLLAIAAENNLAETAFLVAGPRPGSGTDSHFDLRWFTPTVEIDLCGHATVASAKVLFDVLGFAGPTVRFDSNSGVLAVARDGDRFVLDFPCNPPEACETPDGLLEALGLPSAKEVLRGRTNDLLVALDDEAAVRAVDPDHRALAKVPARGVVVTAEGADDDVDLVSRFFGPASGIDEDPVTGSAHTILGPYWGALLGTTELRARQVSPRSGDLWLTLRGDRIDIAGHAVLYLEGTIEI